MKLLDVTLKDLRQSSRSKIAFFFMFALPIGVSLLFLLMFGGIGSEEGFQLPVTEVVIVNLDDGTLPETLISGLSNTLSSSPSSESAQDVGSMGDILVQILRSEEFLAFMTVTVREDERGAKNAVDNREAGLAMILPANFTESLIQSGSTTDVILYQDPTLTIGPLIVEAIIRQILDTFNSAKIGVDVTMEQMQSEGVVPDEKLIQEIVSEFTTSFSGSSGGSEALLITVQEPTGTDEETDLLTEIIGTILGGMTVFFAFYTGAAGMQSILLEEENGTLARLFTTPTSHRAILGGKSLAAILTLVVQITVLFSFGALVLKISWGNPATTILAGIGIIIIAAATGLLLVSLLRNTRQGGVVFGGVLTLTGMLGLIPVFTAGVPDQPGALEIVSLLVPQGWAMRGLTLAMDGAAVPEMLPVLGVILLWSAVFALVGQYRLSKRFA
jgi:ABC-2 type transport system permease protein